MKKKVRVGLAQINTTVGDLSGNCQKIVECTKKGKKLGVDVLVFPELTIAGYPPEDLLLMPEFLNLNKKYLDEVASQTDGIISIIGFADGNVGKTYNAAAVISEGTVAGVYRKMLLPNYGVFDEKRYFIPGSDYPVFFCDGISFAVTICEDIWDDDGPTKMEAAEGHAKIIFNLSSSPYHTRKLEQREKMLSQRASANNVFIAYSNLVGGQDELVFDGAGMVFDNKGSLLCRAKQFEEDLIVADLDIEQTSLPAKPENKKKIKNIFLNDTLKNNKSFVKANTVTKYGRTEEVYKALVTGTRDYIKKNGFKNVVLGLSGGVDSALTAVIAVDALGHDCVNGVLMPSVYSSKGSVDDSMQLVENLKIESFKLPITSVFNAYKETLSGVFEGLDEGVAEENLQARVRGNLLMALSNKFGWLVLATGNKSETSVGYCTLYGDMAGGFAVIKDVPKTLVYELCEYRNLSAGYDIIPKNILTKAPSAELKPDQKDQDSLPPYSVLDDILQLYVEENKTVAEIESKGYDKDLIKKVMVMVDRNEYKRRQSPPGVKITPRAFGKDRRFPVTNRYM